MANEGPGEGIHVPYDENLLERARTQWQFGDWPSLAQLNRDTLQHHPDRAKLALLAAAGRLQTGQDAEANQAIFDGRGRWLAEMTEAEKEQFKNAPAQPLLQQFGYVADRNW